VETNYILPHALAGEQQRLALMSRLLDPLHRRLLESVGLKQGWQCLEVGSGNGSISQWMSKKVGTSGHVVATDIDLQYMQGLAKSNLEVRALNILNETPESNHYDLVTARAVLHHVEQPEIGIRNMAQALRPGGTLLSIEPDFLAAIATTPPHLRAFWQGWLKWSQSVGVNYFIGRKMPDLLAAAGLQQVAGEGTTEIYPGRSLWAQYWLDTIRELKDRLLESGYLSSHTLASFERSYSDPNACTSAITFVATWGKKPG
jgi:SAM-dependent methyltransferase